MVEGKYVRLRQIEESDLAKFRDWRNLEYIRQYTRGFRPLNMANQKKWFESLTDEETSIMFAIEGKGELVGCCGLTPINWKEGYADLSLYMKGVDWKKTPEASDAMQLLLEYGFCELRLHRIYCIAYEYDEQAKKFNETNGFKFEGRHREARFWNGKFHDELVFGMLNYEYVKEVKKKRLLRKRKNEEY